jgi:hypothetical protein
MPREIRAKRPKRSRPVARSLDLREVLHKLADQTADPANLIELYYWGREHDLAAMIRDTLMLPQPVRQMFRMLIKLAKDDPSSLKIQIGSGGKVVLSSPLFEELRQHVDLASSTVEHDRMN